jgi:hypothetical protein
MLASSSSTSASACYTSSSNVKARLGAGSQGLYSSCFAAYTRSNCPCVLLTLNTQVYYGKLRRCAFFGECHRITKCTVLTIAARVKKLYLVSVASFVRVAV